MILENQLVCLSLGVMISLTLNIVQLLAILCVGLSALSLTCQLLVPLLS